GACGSASVTIKDARTGFAHWLIKNGHGCNGHRGGASIFCIHESRSRQGVCDGICSGADLEWCSCACRCAVRLNFGDDWNRSSTLAPERRKVAFKQAGKSCRLEKARNRESAYPIAYRGQFKDFDLTFSIA